jgi:hypothetical protein
MKMQGSVGIKTIEVTGKKMRLKRMVTVVMKCMLMGCQ